MDREEYKIRVLSPIGVYPNRDLIFDDCAFFKDEDICFSISRFHEYDIDDGDEYYSEVEWLNPTEARLYGIVNLATDKHEGYSMFYPFPKTESISLSLQEYQSPNLKEIIKSFLLDIFNVPCVKHPNSGHQIPNYYLNCHDIPLPTIIGDREYRLVEKGINFELIDQLYNDFDINNNLIVRGVTALLKSRMLHEHYQFAEQSINTLFIAMEVSYRLVLGILSAQGNKNPSSKEAMHHLHDVFNDPYKLDSYFEEYYQNRIKAFHPESRFGIYPHAPHCQDDYYHLYRDMNELYCYLISGYVNPIYSEKAAVR
ncbi:hypothetical protein [Microbulbifer sp. TRSA007]|uniref:hypothetical protein n=1 Tax=unclassified Microbulbifer TaxID=2619833 RepID=UPI00403A2584